METSDLSQPVSLSPPEVVSHVEGSVSHVSLKDTTHAYIDMLVAFGDADSEHVFKGMKNMTATHVVVKGKKRSEEQLTIPKSYLKLSTVNTSQKSIIVRFWSNLNDTQKATLLQEAKAAQLLTEQLSISSRTQSTHSDEMCRLMHLKLFPEAQIFLTNSRQPMSRRALDATHLGN